MEISESTIGTSEATVTEPTSASATPAVRTEGVWKIFQQEAEEVQAVRDVTLTIGSGEFTALAGPSGSAACSSSPRRGATAPGASGHTPTTPSSRGFAARSISTCSAARETSSWLYPVWSDGPPAWDRPW